ncbi:MAG: hypothetical protein Kow0037_24640 [Calditrichia bacterium]
MKAKERRTALITLLLSLLLHIILLMLFKYSYLLKAEVTQPETPAPIELEFEQPEQKEETSREEKFYELVENPNATEDTPDESSMLSTANSRSRAPEITSDIPRAVPGDREAESNQSAEPAAAQSDETPQEVKDALLAYREKHSFNKKVLENQKVEDKEEEKSEQEKGETEASLSGFKAEEVGDFALSTYEWSWAPYWLDFKRKLYRVWTTPPAYYKLGLIHGYTIVQFRVSREGKMLNFKVLRHVGHASLEESSVSAVKNSFPLKPLPADFPDEYLDVTLKLIYPNLREYQMTNN